MEVKLWEGGLTLHELEAIDKIKQAFIDNQDDIIQSKNESPKKLTSFDQLAQVSGKSAGMWPWKGYAGFRFVSSKRKEGEFDLVIITHFNVIIVELKHWNGELTASGDQWYQNGEHRGRSAVSITQEKQYLLRDKIKNSGRKFPSFEGNKFDTPRVDFFVVLTGSANGKKLPDRDRKHVLALNEFLELANEKKFEKKFLPHNVPKRYLNLNLNDDLDIFDSIFSDGETKPKSLIVGGYEALEKIFPPYGVKSVYSEYEARSVQSRNDLALLRRWNFTKFAETAMQTRDQRYQVVSHEKKVLTAIKTSDDDLYKACLTSLTNADPSDITQEFYELYELPTGYSRYNAYVDSFVDKLNEEERLGLVKVLLHQFASMHDSHIAHRDIGDHSLWISPANKIALSSFMSAYYQPEGTVGDRREVISTGVISLPEDSEGHSFRKMTPYHRDVYALGIMSYLLIQGKRLSIKSAEVSVNEIQESTEWYADVLRKAISEDPGERFSSAGEMQAALTEAQPAREVLHLYSYADIETYQKKLKGTSNNCFLRQNIHHKLLILLSHALGKMYF